MPWGQKSDTGKPEVQPPCPTCLFPDSSLLPAETWGMSVPMRVAEAIFRIEDEQLKVSGGEAGTFLMNPMPEAVSPLQRCVGCDWPKPGTLMRRR